MIDDCDFLEGFRQGLRAVQGNTVEMPAMVRTADLLPFRSLFQMGVIRGIEHGKGWAEGALCNETELVAAFEAENRACITDAEARPDRPDVVIGSADLAFRESLSTRCEPAFSNVDWPFRNGEISH